MTEEKTMANVLVQMTDRFGNTLTVKSDGTVEVESAHSSDSNRIKAKFYATRANLTALSDGIK